VLREGRLGRGIPALPAADFYEVKRKYVKKERAIRPHPNKDKIIPKIAKTFLRSFWNKAITPRIKAIKLKR
jgi:hypothetical protein